MVYKALEEGASKPLSEKEYVSLIYGVCLSLMIPQEQRKVHHIDLCLRLTSSKGEGIVKNPKEIFKVFQKTPLDKRERILELIGSKIDVIEHIWTEESLVAFIASLPDGEEVEICQIIEKVIPKLIELKDHNLIENCIKCFVLLPSNQRNQINLEVLIKVFSCFLVEKEEKNCQILEQAVAMLREVNDSKCLKHAISFFALLPENRQDQMCLKNCIFFFARLFSDQKWMIESAKRWLNFNLKQIPENKKGEFEKIIYETTS